MIILDRTPKVGKVPSFRGGEYGKLSISSLALGKYVGRNLRVIIRIVEPGEYLSESEELDINKMSLLTNIHTSEEGYRKQVERDSIKNIG